MPQAFPGLPGDTRGSILTKKKKKEEEPGTFAAGSEAGITESPDMGARVAAAEAASRSTLPTDFVFEAASAATTSDEAARAAAAIARELSFPSLTEQLRPTDPSADPVTGGPLSVKTVRRLEVATIAELLAKEITRFQRRGADVRVPAPTLVTAKKRIDPRDIEAYIRGMAPLPGKLDAATALGAAVNLAVGGIDPTRFTQVLARFAEWNGEEGPLNEEQVLAYAHWWAKQADRPASPTDNAITDIVRPEVGAARRALAARVGTEEAVPDVEGFGGLTGAAEPRPLVPAGLVAENRRKLEALQGNIVAQPNIWRTQAAPIVREVLANERLKETSFVGKGFHAFAGGLDRLWHVVAGLAHVVISPASFAGAGHAGDDPVEAWKRHMDNAWDIITYKERPGDVWADDLGIPRTSPLHGVVSVTSEFLVGWFIDPFVLGGKLRKAVGLRRLALSPEAATESVRWLKGTGGFRNLAIPKQSITERVSGLFAQNVRRTWAKRAGVTGRKIPFREWFVRQSIINLDDLAELPRGLYGRGEGIDRRVGGVLRQYAKETYGLTAEQLAKSAKIPQELLDDAEDLFLVALGSKPTTQLGRNFDTLVNDTLPRQSRQYVREAEQARQRFRAAEVTELEEGARVAARVRGEELAEGTRLREASTEGAWSWRDEVAAHVEMTQRAIPQVTSPLRVHQAARDLRIAIKHSPFWRGKFMTWLRPVTEMKPNVALNIEKAEAGTMFGRWLDQFEMGGRKVLNPQRVADLRTEFEAIQRLSIATRELRWEKFIERTIREMYEGMGLDARTVEEIVKNAMPGYHQARRAAQRAFGYQRVTLGGELSEAPYREPVLESHLLNTLVLPDPQLVKTSIRDAAGSVKQLRDSALERFGREVEHLSDPEFKQLLDSQDWSFAKLFGRGTQASQRASDIFMRVWKPLVLLRPTWTVRVVLMDENIRGIVYLQSALERFLGIKAVARTGKRLGVQDRTISLGGRPVDPFVITPATPESVVQATAQPGYYYHATTPGALDSIGKTGLFPRRPPGGAWEDGATSSRLYFSLDPDDAFSMTGEKVNTVILRTRQDVVGSLKKPKAFIPWEGYAERAVDRESLEFLGADAQWHRVGALEDIEISAPRAAGLLPDDEAANAIQMSDAFRSASAYEGQLARNVTDTMSPITFGQKNYYRELAIQLNQQAGNSPLARRIAAAMLGDNQWNKDAVVRWLTKDNRGQALLRRGNRSPEDAVERAWGWMDYYTKGDEATLRAILNPDGPTVSEELVARVFPDNGPILSRVQMDEALLRRRNPFTKMIDSLFSIFAQRPTNYLTRHPFFKNVYSREVERLGLLKKEQLARTGEKLSKDALDRVQLRIEQQSREYALTELKRVMYTLTERSRFFEAARGVFPFGAPFQEQLSVWGSLLWDNPHAIGHARLLYRYAKQNGVLFSDPDTGEDMIRVPEALASPLLSIVTGLPTQNMPKGWGISMRLEGLNLFTQSAIKIPTGQIAGDLSIPFPGFSYPAMELVQEYVKHGPLPRNVRGVLADWAFQYGPDTSILPKPWERLLSAAGVLPGGNALVKRTANHFLDYAAAAGQEVGTEYTIDQAKRDARKFLAMRAMFGWLLPAAPTIEWPQQEIRDEFFERAESGYNEALDWLRATYPDRPDIQMLGISHTVWTEDTPRIPANEAVNKILALPAFKETAQKHPEFVYALLPRMVEKFPYSYNEYLEQLASGVRKSRAPSARVEELHTRQGWEAYFSAKDAFDAFVDGNDVTEGDSAWETEKARFDAVVDELKEANPAWASDYSKIEAFDADLQRHLRLAQSALDESPILRATEAGQGLQAYLNGRNEIEGIMREHDIGGLDSAGARLLRLDKRYETLVAETKERYPQFGTFYHLWFERDLQRVTGQSRDDYLEGLPTGAAKVLADWNREWNARRDRLFNPENDVDQARASAAVRAWALKADEYETQYGVNPLEAWWTGTHTEHERNEIRITTALRPYVFLSQFEKREILGIETDPAADEAWLRASQRAIKREADLREAERMGATKGPIHEAYERYLLQLARENPAFAKELKRSQTFGYGLFRVLPSTWGKGNTTAADAWKNIHGFISTLNQEYVGRDITSFDPVYDQGKVAFEDYVTEWKDHSHRFKTQWEYLDNLADGSLIDILLPPVFFPLKIGA